jgi:DNA primase
MRTVGEGDVAYVAAILARLEEMHTLRRVAALKGRLQRMNPVEQGEDYMRMFGQMLTLEQQARSLRERAMGGLTP